MPSKRKLGLIVACIMAPYVIYVIYLGAIGSDAITELPKWMLWAGLTYFIGSILAIGMIARALSKKELPPPGEELLPALSPSARRLKSQLIRYCVILVFAIVIVLLKIVPLKLAVTGLVVDISFILFSARSLVLLKRRESERDPV